VSPGAGEMVSPAIPPAPALGPEPGGVAEVGVAFVEADAGDFTGALFTPTWLAALSSGAGLPPIRLHDLRHTAASLALQAGVPLKVVSEQLGHSSLAITADTCTSVLPAVAQAAAEAVAGIVPRAANNAADAGVLSVGYQKPPKEAKMSVSGNDPSTKGQVRRGGPPGARTQNLRIKRPDDPVPGGAT